MIKKDVAVHVPSPLHLADCLPDDIVERGGGLNESKHSVLESVPVERRSMLCQVTSFQF